MTWCVSAGRGMSQIDPTSERFTSSCSERILGTNQIWVDETCILQSMSATLQHCGIEYSLIFIYVEWLFDRTTVIRIYQTETKICLCHNYSIFKSNKCGTLINLIFYILYINPFTGFLIAAIKMSPTLHHMLIVAQFHIRTLFWMFLTV
jgi:hypothetical protein